MLLVDVGTVQFLANLCSPGADGIPIPKVADWRLHPVEHPLLEKVQFAHIERAMKYGNIAGLDVVNDWLQATGKSPSL